jgi:methylase of polypeptide subunit release factors
MTSQGVRWATEPFVMGTPEQFAQLREWMLAAGYTEAEVCGRADVRTMAHFHKLGTGRTVFTEPTDTLSFLVLLFLDGNGLPWETVRSILSSDEMGLLEALGLLRPAVADADYCVSPVALFPIEDIYIVCDRLESMETIGDGLPPDLVFSPLTPETLRFIGLMPRPACEDYLEICGGTGAAALLAARQFARRSASADITERSTRFARFSAALNGIENFVAVQGDLYEPVAGRTFDLITAHPPYVPAVETEMVFRDGGQDGEQITRRIVAGLGEYLRPGGLFYLDCVLTDRSGSALEERVRRMLGPAEDEFDVVVVRGGTVDPQVYHADRLRSGRLTPELFSAQTALFKQLAIEQFVTVTVLIQRRIGMRPVVTRHRMLSGETRAEDLQWLLHYLTETVEWGAEETRRLLDCRPRALPTTELRVRSALREGHWVPVETTISTKTPFAVQSPAPAFLPTFLSRCDGEISARVHLDRLRAEGLVPPSATDDDFAQLIRELSDGPYIELGIFPLPSARSRKFPVLA